MIKVGTKHEWAKGIIGLLIVIIAYAIFLLFFNLQDNILGTSNYYPFMILTIIAGAFLIGLFYLVNKPQVKKVKATHKASKSSKKKKSR